MADWHRTRHALKRLAFWLFLALLLGSTYGVLYLVKAGVPQPLLHRIVAHIHTRCFAMEADGLQIVPAEGFVFRGVRIFRKGVVGPPAVEVARVTINLRMIGALRDGSALRRVRAVGGLVRTEFLTGGVGSEAAEAGLIPCRTNLPPRLPHVDFALEVEDFHLYDTRVDDASCRLRMSDSTVRLDDIHGRLSACGKSGRAAGNVAYDPAARTLSADLSTDLDPRLLLPLIRERHLHFVEKLVDRFDFGARPPSCEATFHARCGRDWSLDLDGRFEFERARYRGVEISRAVGEIQVDASQSNALVRIDPLTVERPEGAARAGFTVDTGRRQVSFDGASTLDPQAMCGMIGVLTNLFREHIQCRGPVEFNGHGAVDYEAMTDTDFTMHAIAKDFSLWKYDAQEVSFQMHMKGLTNTLSEIHGTAYGGQVEGTLTLVVPWKSEGKTTFALDGKVENADFQKMTSALLSPENRHKEYRGSLSGHLSLSGATGSDNLDSLRGDGTVSIRNGRIFMLPLFGGLSGVMTKLIPGLDFVLRQNDANAAFTIADGRLHSDRIQVEGDILSLTGYGDYAFHGDIDGHARVTLMKEHALVAKLLRLLIYPIGKLFEFRVKGNPSSPQWYPENFSRDLLEHLGLVSHGDASEAGGAKNTPTPP